MGPYVHNIKHTLWDVNMIVTLIGGKRNMSGKTWDLLG